MTGRPVLVLVGPPGSGKSTVGQVLSRRLGTAFTDVDTVIETRIGKTIADMFTEDGEPAFRALEREVVAELLGTDCGVLALGGGSVLAAETRERLRGHRVAWLTVGLTDGLRRTGMSTARPLLAGVNPRATFRTLLEARAPLYAEVATVEIDTSRRSAAQAATATLRALGLADPEQTTPAGEDGCGDADWADSADGADRVDHADGADCADHAEESRPAGRVQDVTILPGRPQDEASTGRG